MKLTVTAKAWLYTVFTGLVMAFSLSMQNSMHTEGQLESGYFRASLALAAVAVTVMGIGVYAMLSFRKSRKVKRPVDAWFAAGIGLVLLIVAVSIIMTYGGLSRPFGEAGYTAANIMVAVLSLLPLPWMIRLLTLSFRKGETPSAQRTVLRVVSVLYILSVCF